ncbi:Mammalian cell entry related domain protein [Chthoniobacter flavus Ellin428]|uniref:Mammalian cell entry related domain protein n=1 Tax=Chthoniobacter flavus Ellin428 TaxID=497964 RepID=B4D2R0_9BACT|nr:MlaD family protein [Chthoniobacter flavus]EDY19500.1 Mammalian cell entry related domain protein [Chthoniobacter flavus Ellin428]TCO82887.1 ABC-type transporter Mla subunit MlaD [Chthoniobacter flavus]
MNLVRNEIRTGLLVVITLVVLVGVLIFLGAPGVFVPQHTYRIYFENAAGVKPGAPVLLGGRKIGQVRSLFSPVEEKDRPNPKLETMIEVTVAARARIFKTVKVEITQPTMLGDAVIDFASGKESSGLAPDGAYFVGERAPSLSDLPSTVMERLDPVLTKLNGTLDSLEKTSNNLTRLTAEGADLQEAFAEFKQFGVNLNEISGYDSSLRHSLQNIETLTSDNGKLGQSLNHLAELTGPDGSLSKTFKNTEKFTSELTAHDDAAVILHNFRAASENLDRALTQIGQQFTTIGGNLEQASDTVKRQPWRLIWPTTKKYPEPAPGIPARGEKATPSPTPKKRR